MCNGCGGVNFTQVNKKCVDFNVCATLKNEYHTNPSLIGKSKEEAKDVLAGLANGRNPKLNAEAGALERSRGSKCLAAWTQAEAYHKLSEWCNSKQLDVPSEITSWLRFIGNGARGFLGYTEFLLSLPPDGGPPPSATATSNCTGGCATEKQLLRQTVETLKAQVIELETAGKIVEQQLQKLTDQEQPLKDKCEKKTTEVINLNKKLKRAVEKKGELKDEKKTTEKSLKRKQKIIDDESPQQRTRKDLHELAEGGGQQKARLKLLRMSAAPKTSKTIEANNKEMNAKGR